MHFVASGSETIVDSSSQGVYVKYNGGDVCNVDVCHYYVPSVLISLQ